MYCVYVNKYSTVGVDQVSCPLSYGRPPTKVFLKYKKDDEEVGQVEGDTEGNSGRVETGTCHVVHVLD